MVRRLPDREPVLAYGEARELNRRAADSKPEPSSEHSNEAPSSPLNAKRASDAWVSADGASSIEGEVIPARISELGSDARSTVPAAGLSAVTTTRTRPPTSPAWAT